ncbi:MAG: acetate--CoA ligase family protein [Candidatus Thiodiazotropha sp.]|jgi:acyl-CoA synthetase (NDP forming)
MSKAESFEISSIQRLLRPRSVAIVGASSNPSALGASVLANLERANYSGDIHLINPKRDEINGRPCLKSIDDLTGWVDCAVLAIPRVAVLESVRACARRGVGGVVIFSSGFAETGEEGRAEQQEIARIAQEHGMEVMGPNCLGLVNYVDSIALTFMQIHPGPLQRGPGIAVVSQSGAMAAVLATSLRARDLNVSYSVSTGNEAVSGVEDYVEYILEDPNSKAVTMIVEQFRNPERFLALARRARGLGKRIVLLHPGRSSAARESAATHTGVMAGDYQTMRSLVERAGVIVVETLEELLDVSEIIGRCDVKPNTGCAVLTESGAFKALALDLCEDVDLPLSPLKESTHAGLMEVLPEFIPPSNPLDLTAQVMVDPSLYRRTMNVLLQEEDFGSIVMGIILCDKASSDLKLPHIVNAIKDLAPEKPVIFAGLDEGGEISERYVQELRKLGVPFFASAERVFRALALLSAPLPMDPGPTVQGKIPPVLIQASGVVPEYRSKEILAAFGVPLPKGEFVGSVEEAIAAAQEIGYPVVLKAQSAELPLKSDAVGVECGIDTSEALRAGWARLYENLAKAGPGLEPDGVLVEGMGGEGVELFIGARNDPDWGPVLRVGFGGVMAELFHDTRLIPANLPPQEIVQELLELKSAALLRGFRGAPAVDVAAAAQIVAQVGKLIQADSRIREIEVNPMMVYPEGEGAIALGGLIYID